MEEKFSLKNYKRPAALSPESILMGVHTICLFLRKTLTAGSVFFFFSFIVISGLTKLRRESTKESVCVFFLLLVRELSSTFFFFVQSGRENAFVRRENCDSLV